MVQWKGLKSICCGEPRLLQCICTIIVQPVDSNFIAVFLSVIFLLKWLSFYHFGHVL